MCSYDKITRQSNKALDKINKYIQIKITTLYLYNISRLAKVENISNKRSIKTNYNSNKQIYKLYIHNRIT